MNTLRIQTMLGIFIASAAVLVTGIGSAAAHTTVTSHNHTTGPGSINQNNTTVNNRTSVRIVNNSDIRNTVSINANTGHNQTNGNTVVGNVRTGDIRSTVTTNNSVGSGGSSSTWHHHSGGTGGSGWWHHHSGGTGSTQKSSNRSR